MLSLHSLISSRRSSIYSWNKFGNASSFFQESKSRVRHLPAKISSILLICPHNVGVVIWSIFDVTICEQYLVTMVWLTAPNIQPYVINGHMFRVDPLIIAGYLLETLIENVLNRTGLIIK